MGVWEENVTCHALERKPKVSAFKKFSIKRLGWEDSRESVTCISYKIKSTWCGSHILGSRKGDEQNPDLQIKLHVAAAGLPPENSACSPPQYAIGSSPAQCSGERDQKNFGLEMGKAWEGTPGGRKDICESWKGTWGGATGEDTVAEARKQRGWEPNEQLREPAAGTKPTTKRSL